MKKIRIPVLLATIYLIVYTISPNIGLPAQLTIFMWSLSPLIVVGLVIWVLKKGEPSGKKWSEGYFYDDEEIKSVAPEKE